MRHLTRLYFDNPKTDNATVRYVAIFDQGVDSGGNPRFNSVDGLLQSAQDIVDALRYFLQAACFFKLPVGASAIVDVLVPDGVGPQVVKTFDYQVFKSQIPTPQEDPTSADLAAEATGAATEVLDQLKKSIVESSSPMPVRGPSLPTQSMCSTLIPGGCGGQTSMRCPDPVLLVAECVDGRLECIAPEPPGPSEDE